MKFSTVVLRALVSNPASSGVAADPAAGQGGAPAVLDDRGRLQRDVARHQGGRISYDHKPYAGEEHARWRWFLNDTQRNRMANDRCATREEAMAAFREAFDRVPDNTVDKSA